MRSAPVVASCRRAKGVGWMTLCKVTVWEPGVSSGVPYEYSAPEGQGCEIEYGKAALFQNEVGAGAEVEYQVEIWDPTAQSWSVVRPRGNRRDS